MASDLQIPQSAYRQFRRSSGIDPATRRLALIAAGVCGVLVVLAGGWMMVGHRPAGVPLVLADTHPIRVKPENPGGLQVIGANDELQPGTTGDGRDAVAPAPETPQLQALQQEIQAAKAASAAAAPASAPPTTLATATPATTLATGRAGDAAPGAAPAPTTTGTAPPFAAAPAAVLAPPRATAASAAAGGATVQVAALGSEQAARTEWDRLSKRAPSLLDGRKPLIERADVGGRTVYRLRIAGFASTAAATEFCGQLRAKGGGCSLADF